VGDFMLIQDIEVDILIITINSSVNILRYFFYIYVCNTLFFRGKGLLETGAKSVVFTGKAA